MTALAGFGVAVTKPVASSAAKANPIGSFMLESSMWGIAKCKLGALSGKGAKS